MSSDAFVHALSPVAVGGVELRNRIVMPSHTVLYGEDHQLSDRHIAYYRERALGGTGLVITEGGFVHESQLGAFHNAITAYRPGDVARFAALADALHALDARVFVQLVAIGVHMQGTQAIDHWTPLWGASAVPSVRDREVPLAMEREQLAELVDGFVRSAVNMRAAGVDGIELHAAHSYLLGQFMSPAYNRRTDGYGGSIEGRARLVLEIAEAIRARVGDELALSLRLSFDEGIGPAGITPEDSEAFLELFAASGLFDLFNISGGGYHALHQAVAPMNVEEGHMVPFARRTKAVVGDRAKVMIVGRIATVEAADAIVAEGAADLVGMTRAHMVDPFLVENARRGRGEDTMRCVAANECFNSGGRQITCMMNPAMGRERRWGRATLHRVAAGQERRVLVVGGGPAGMKVAGVAASRGHAVTLVEAADELGGHLALLRRLPTREGWQRAIDNLARPLVREGVEVRLGFAATADWVRARNDDAIVIATGASWQRSGFSQYRPERDALAGADQDHVLDVGTACRRALADGHALGRRVAILDETGAYLPIGLAELLADAGCDVELITTLPVVGDQLAATSDQPFAFPRLYAKGVRMTPQTAPEAIAPGRLTVRHVWSGERTERTVDSVVISMLRSSRDALYHELEDVRARTQRVGDALAPRSTAAVIYEGEELGRAIASAPEATAPVPSLDRQGAHR